MLNRYAQMSQRFGRWRLYVVLYNTPGPWPEHRFPVSSQVPTLAERSRALNALGFVLTDDTEWRWIEDSEDPDDPSTPVVLMAAATVEEVAR